MHYSKFLLHEEVVMNGKGVHVPRDDSQVSFQVLDDVGHVLTDRAVKAEVL